MRNGYRVVDVDSHVTPSMEVLNKFAGTEIKSRWDEFSPYFRTMNSPLGRGHPESPWTTIKINPIPYDRIAGQPEVAEKVKKAGGSGPLEGRVQNIAKDLPTTGTQHENSEGRISDMDVEGVDVNVLIPGTWASASSSLDSSLTTGLYGAYHNYMKEFCGNHPKRLKGLMLAACGDVDWTVNELKSRGEEEWMSCVWPILPEGLPVDDPSLEPIWEVMNDLELPMIYHSFFYEPPYFPGYRDIWGNAAIARCAAHPWGAQRIVSYVICGGILDRYPNLKICCCESGHGWLPYWLFRLDSQVEYVKGAVPKLKCLPSDYARQGRVLCNIEASEGEMMTKAVMDLLGENCLVYGSDFPHPECDWPKSVDNVLGWKSISETAMKKLLGDNADTYLR